MRLQKALSPVWFKPDPDDPAEFLLRPFTSLQLISVRAHAFQRQDGGLAFAGAAQMEAVQASISDWRGIEDDAGPVQFAPAKVQALPFKIVESLFGELIRLAALSEMERKNSSSPSTST